MSGTHLHDFMWKVRALEPYLDFFVKIGQEEYQSLINNSIIRADDTAKILGAELIWKEGAWCGGDRFIDHEVLEDWAPGVTIAMDGWRDPAISCDLLLVTALEMERSTIWSALEKRARLDGLALKIKANTALDTVFQILPVTGGAPLSVVLTAVSGKGNVRSAIRTTQALMRWSPLSLGLIGITGGRRGEVVLSDIILGSAVVDYESVKLDPQGNHLFDGTVCELSPKLRHAMISWPEVDEFLDSCPKKLGLSVRPALREGVIASGEKVVNDDSFFPAVTKIHRKVIGVETELAGLVTATREGEFQGNTFFLKVVVDYADGTKGDEVHESGMATLANVLVELARHGCLTQRPN